MITRPFIYKISASEDFFEILANGIIEKISPTYKLKDVTILLPTLFACHNLNAKFKQLGQGFPKIYPISDLSGAVNISDKYLDRMALLNKITKIIISMKIKNFEEITAITELAEYLADFLYRAESYQIDLNNLLQIIFEDQTLDKQELCQILKEFISIWIKDCSLTKAGYSNLLIQNFTTNLKGTPLIIAGINSNLPSITELLIRSSSFKNTNIILYGLDDNLTPDDWNNIEATHCQYNFKNILDVLSVNPNEILNWNIQKRPNPFISYALKPAKSCNNWHELNDLDTEHISYFSFNDHHVEAKEIVSLVKSNLDKSIMIVTMDDDLMVKIMLHLQAESIDANIIRDYPLNKSKSFIWLELCLNFILDKYSLISALALLKHPLADIDKQSLINLELAARDKNFYSNNIFNVNIECDFITKLQQVAENFKSIKSYTSFQNFLNHHIIFAESIAKESLWENIDGEELKAYLDQLLEHFKSIESISFKEYPKLFHYMLKSGYYRNPIETNKKITLAKPIDARLQNKDLVIIAGLNEGVWPKQASIDPCFNGKTLTKIGFPQFEESIGMEAYDFYCFANSKEVILTRSEKIDGVIAKPSRFLLRILTLAKKGSIFKDTKIDITQINEIQSLATPALEHRPTKLSVTQIEKLIFNPYHIYVDLILKLKKLPPLIKELSALDFGNFIHKALEIYHDQNISMIEAGNQALSILRINSPQVKLLWWPRFLRIAKWFLANENKSIQAHLETSGFIKINDNFIITAKADRIELFSNSVNIIDYKTGKLTTAKAIYNGKSLQLVLEALIASNGGFKCQTKKSYQIQSLVYIELSGGEDPAKILEIDITNKPILEEAKKYIYSLAKEYQNPLTPYYYTQKKVLGYCPYSHLSRKFI